MKIFPPIFICSIFVTLLVAANAAGNKPAVASFCLKEKLTGATGREEIPLGTFTAQLSVYFGHSKTRVYFADEMPDSGQVLLIDNAPAVRIGPGTYTVRFNDNWENKGDARLTIGPQTAHIVFGGVEPNSDSQAGQNAQRGYGDFVLTKAACRKDRKAFPKDMCPEGGQDCFKGK